MSTASRPGPARVRLRAWCFAASALGAASAVFADVQFEPEVVAGLSRTDNLTLASEDEQSETVLQLRPGFGLTQESRRLTSNVAYQFEGYYYNNRGDTEIYHQLDSDVSFGLDPDNFFLEFGASRNQSIRDPRGPIPRSNLPISGNRIDRDEFYAGPQLQYPLGGDTTARGSYRRSWIRYGEPLRFGGIGGLRRDYDTDAFDFSLDNYERERGFTWALRYNARQTDYGIFQPWEFRQASAELGGWIGEGLRVFATGGKESAWDQPFDPSLEDTFWEAGFSKIVAERLRAEFAAGERTFGSSRRAALELTFLRGSTELSYREQPTTQGLNPFERGGLLVPEEPEDFLTRPGSAERYISKRAQWVLGLELTRTTFSFRVFDETREQRTQIDGTPLPDEQQTGASFSASRRLGANTEVGLEARRVRRDFSATDERDLTTASLWADYALGARTQLRLEYERSEEDSDGGGLARDYTANLISLLLTRTF